jgi:hypothetical protein
MPIYDQRPGRLGLAFRGGDEVSTQIDFDGVSLVGYTVTSSLVSLVTGGVVQPVTTTLSDAAAGVVNISLTEAQTAALPAGTYGFVLQWNAPGDVLRTVYEDYAEVT